VVIEAVGRARSPRRITGAVEIPDHRHRRQRRLRRARFLVLEDMLGLSPRGAEIRQAATGDLGPLDRGRGGGPMRRRVRSRALFPGPEHVYPPPVKGKVGLLLKGLSMDAGRSFCPCGRHIDRVIRER